MCKRQIHNKRGSFPKMPFRAPVGIFMELIIFLSFVYMSLYIIFTIPFVLEKFIIGMSNRKVMLYKGSRRKGSIILESSWLGIITATVLCICQCKFVCCERLFFSYVFEWSQIIKEMEEFLLHKVFPHH